MTRNEVLRKREEYLSFGGQDKVEKQKKQGKLLARERIMRLLDTDTFYEIDEFVTHRCNEFHLKKEKFLGDGVITGLGRVNGLKVAIYSQDFTCWGGALGEYHAKKICKIMDIAVENNFPIIGISDSGGARIHEGVDSLAGYAEIFKRNVRSSGVVPQISLILGPCAGGAVYSPAITDFVFMVEKSSYMFVTGPDVIKTVTHEEVTKEELGGADAHHKKSGVTHFVSKDEDECFMQVRELIDYIKEKDKKVSDNLESSGLKGIVPENPKAPYNMKDCISKIIDDSNFLEVQKDYAENIICGFARIGGKSIGVVANQPMFLAGVLDIDASLKAARFVRFCDAFDIPVLTLVDVPGFLPGVNQEHGGIIKHGAKLLYAYSEATVPLVTLIVRKAYGGAYDVMASKHIGADINISLPTGQIAVMGAEGAVNIIFRKELKGLSEKEYESKRRKLIDEYELKFNNPYVAAERGYLDKVILPEEAKKVIYDSFKFHENKKVNSLQKKHGNIPL